MSIGALRQLLKRGRFDNETVYDVLMKARQKGYTDLTDAEKAQYDMLYNMFGRDAMRTMEDRLFYSMGGKYPELDDMVSAGRYLDDDVLTDMFNKKINSVIDDFAVRAEKLKDAKNPNDEAMVLIDEMLEDDTLELLRDRKSINDLSGGFFTDDMMTVDPEGRLDVLVDSLQEMQYSEALSPEYLAHNLRGTKRHINALPEKQIKHKKKSGTVEDTDFWDEDYEYEPGVINPRDKDRMDALYDSSVNVASEGKYTPTTPMDPGVDATVDASGQIQWNPDPGPRTGASPVTDEEIAQVNRVLEEDALKNLGVFDDMFGEIGKKKLKKKAGGGFIDRPLYDD